MKNLALGTLLGLALLSAGCDDSSHTHDTAAGTSGGASGGATAGTPTGPGAATEPATTATAAAGEHKHLPLGEATVGSLKLVATMDAPVKASGGGEAAFDVLITGIKPKAVRFWVGTEDAKESVKAKAEEETADQWHTHVEVPSPLPPNSKFWVEVEPPTGDKLARSFDLKIQQD